MQTWNTKRWLLRSFIITFLVSGCVFGIQYQAKKYAELRYQNTGYVQKQEVKKAKKDKKKQTSVSAASVNAKKPEFTPWYLIVLYVGIGSMTLSALVQKWGWKPIFNLLLIGLVVGVILTILGVKMEANQRRNYD